MNLKQIRKILKDTDFVHTSGTPEELRVAEYLKEFCAALGAEVSMETFAVPMSEMRSAHLYADGREIPCEGYRCCGGGEVEAELYYMPGDDELSLRGVRGKIVLLDTGVSHFLYQDLFSHGAMGFITYDGDAHYADLAHKHVTTCLANSIRPDGSTYHTFFMDPVTGGPVRGATCQGYKDDSCWARGQAWGVYGTAISYRYTRRPEYLDAFRRVLAYYLERLPEDLVPYWDMTFTSGTEEPRDSSSASIVACGLLEAAKYVGTDEAAEYTKLAAQMLGSVAAHYAVKEGPQGIGLVRHGTYSKKSPYNTCTPEGVDECVSWGDYFYMEALTRLTKDWELYW